MEKWFWLPDWASDLSLWEDDLTNANPDAEHIFVSYDEMVKHLNCLYDLKGLAKASTVVAWGLGALALMKASADKPEGQKWILLSPFSNFCEDSSNWTDQTLIFMARQVKNSVEPTLNAFLEFFENEFGEWQDDWFKAASKMNKEALSDGLNYLVQNSIESCIENSQDIKILYGRMDQAVLPSMTLALKEFLPKAEFKERPKAGHWPPMLML
ncbi:MAG: alpha/beta hydrolase [Fibrobacter sp.]|nr:alpha/beta hydrolase [Fibrobacter sp.]